MDKNKRRTLRSWLSVVALFALCGVLCVLQYRWIGEVSVASRERLRAGLQASLNRLSQDFDAEIMAACAALQPRGLLPGDAVREEDYAARYARWKASARHNELFRRVAIAAPEGSRLVLRSLDLDRGVFGTAEWPAAWSGVQDRLAARLTGGPPGSPGRPMPAAGEGLVLEFPRLGRPSGPPAPMSNGNPAGWLIVELNLDYIQSVILPEVLQRYLGSSTGLDYQAEIVTSRDPHTLIYRSDPTLGADFADRADASVGLLRVEGQRRRPGSPYGGRGRVPNPDLARGRGPGPDEGRGRGPGGESARWELFVRHRAGSLEAVVSRARWRNLAVTAAVLLLMLATTASLIRYTRQAQRLAELQMDFVAGVSHELRTPLTVMRTAAYNLQGRLSNNPGQVVRYGALIQRESERLTTLVEQVLQFAGSHAGLAIREPQPVSVQKLIEDGVESSKAVLDEHQCSVEEKIEPGLPQILGDPTALKHALQNLLSNAAKHGRGDGNWVGVFASRPTDPNEPFVEIRVADRGPGIPADELERVFEPFFRGRRALQSQIHGTGLGLSLVKQIVEAHRGTVSVRSLVPQGTEFVVRIPAAAPEHQDELTHSAG